MGAMVPRHALIFRVHRLALAGMTGAWLVAGMLGTGPARAGESDGGLAGPSPKPTQTDASAPVPASRRAPHQAYLFFPGDRPASRRPAVAAIMRATPNSTSTPPVDARRPPYLFCTPLKKSNAQTPVPVDMRRPSYLFFTPGKKNNVQTPTPDSGPGPGSKPPVLGVEVAGEGLPLTPTQPRLLFFSPRRGAANSGRPPVTNLTAPANRPKPTSLAAIERVPVRLPGTPTRSPQPYLIFQPKPVRDRLSAVPKAEGTSSSAAAPPSQDVTAGVPKKPESASRPATARHRVETLAPLPTKTNSPAPPTSRVWLVPKTKILTLDPLEISGFGLEPTSTLAALPPLRFAPLPGPASKPNRTTPWPPPRLSGTPRRVLQAPSVGNAGNHQAPRSR